MSDVGALLDMEALVGFVKGRGQRYWLAPGLYDADNDEERVDDLFEYFLKNQEFHEEMVAIEGLLANIQAKDNAGEQVLEAMKYAVSQAISISTSVVFELPSSSTSTQPGFLEASNDNGWLAMLQQWGFALDDNFAGLVDEDDGEEEEEDEDDDEDDDDEAKNGKDEEEDEDDDEEKDEDGNEAKNGDEKDEDENEAKNGDDKEEEDDNEDGEDEEDENDAMKGDEKEGGAQA